MNLIIQADKIFISQIRSGAMGVKFSICRHFKSFLILISLLWFINKQSLGFKRSKEPNRLSFITFAQEMGLKTIFISLSVKNKTTQIITLKRNIWLIKMNVNTQIFRVSKDRVIDTIPILEIESDLILKPTDNSTDESTKNINRTKGS